MPTFTKADLATRILRDAGLIGAEETPSAVDLLFAEETLSAEIDLMAATGIRIWDGDEEQIPNSYLTALSRRIVLALSPAFGLASAAEVEVGIDRVEKTLRKLSAIPGTEATVKSTYY